MVLHLEQYEVHSMWSQGHQMSQWWEDYDRSVDDDRRKPDPEYEVLEVFDSARDSLSDLVSDVLDDERPLRRGNSP